MAELLHAIAQARIHQTAQGQGRRTNIPSPVYGWNTRDPEARMKPQFAINLTNFFPEHGLVRTRKGAAQFADTTDTAAVQTLFSWVSGTNEKLYAAAGTKLYDVTDPEMVTEAVTTGITSSRWRSANYGGHGILVNGTDEPLRVDSSGSWVPHGFTGPGLATANLTDVIPFKNRLFFLEKDSPKLWYAGLQAITGPLERVQSLVCASRRRKCGRNRVIDAGYGRGGR